MAFETVDMEKAFVIKASGRITIGGGDAALRNTIQQAVADGHLSIIVDMEKVKALDSSGVGELVAAQLLLQGRGGRLALTGLSPRVGGVLMATRIAGVIELHDSLDVALFAAA